MAAVVLQDTRQADKLVILYCKLLHFSQVFVAWVAVASKYWNYYLTDF